MLESDSSGNHCVLIVDDDQLTALALMRALKDDHLNIVAVAEGSRAISEIQSKPYALVFLEIGIGDGTGMTVLHEISRSFPFVCIVVMSAGIPNGEAENAIIGYDHYFLPKPFEVLQVRTMTRKILSEASKTRADNFHLEIERKQKRSSERQPRSGQIIFVPDPDGSHPGIPSRFAANIVDVSHGGMGVRTDLPLPPGQIFSFADDTGTNEGIVRWSMVFEDRFRAGIQFI